MCVIAGARHREGMAATPAPPPADEDRACRGVRQQPWQAVARRAASQAHVISTEQLRACGLSTDAIARATRTGHLHVVHRGVRALGSGRLAGDGLLWAAVLAVGPDCALIDETAAAVAGFRPLGDPIHVAAPTQRRSHRGVVAHRVAGLSPDWLRRRRGLPVVRPAHALLDLAAHLPDDALAVALNEALSLRVVRLHELDAVCDLRRGHAGLGRLAAVVAATREDPGRGRTRSELEHLVLPKLRAMPGLPPYRRNQRVTLAGGRVAVADILFPGVGVMVELDSRRWHEQRRAMDSDRRRDQQALAVGLITFRITWRHATHQWPQVSADLLRTLATAAERQAVAAPC